MKKISLAAALLAAMPTTVLAQETATVVTAETVAKLSATAAANQRGSNPPANALQQIIVAGPYTLNLEHRIAKTPASIEQTQAEVIIVLDGAGTLTTGGTLVNAVTLRGGVNGDDIASGEIHHIVKGDIMIVPEMTPHMLAPVSGSALVLATLDVPRDGTSVSSRGFAAPKLFNAATDLPAMIARAKAAIPNSARFFGGESILNLAPYHMGLEYRSPKGIASVHKNDGEFMYVLEGEGNIPAGGTVVNPKDSGANIDGDALQGATDHFMKKGDFIYVPAGVPHLAISDGTFVLATLHVPSSPSVAR